MPRPHTLTLLGPTDFYDDTPESGIVFAKNVPVECTQKDIDRITVLTGNSWEIDAYVETPSEDVKLASNVIQPATEVGDETNPGVKSSQKAATDAAKAATKEAEAEAKVEPVEEEKTEETSEETTPTEGF